MGINSGVLMHGTARVTLSGAYIDGGGKPMLTRSGYNWLLRRNTETTVPDRIWKYIAKLNTLPKIKIFAWRVCHEALPSGCRILSAGLGDGHCKLCERAVETVVH
ncbi:hypothetical protein V6N12_014795 [Hibiscus sabdariffa]|uniref:Reverse transcriptase zinc-binding domain-containing protein n=1 Tax=Hibiscus sabdariffa TaxID=183260 RepID=A0ABR2DLA0_9ROSI